MVSLESGLVGGLVATIGMTVLMMALGDDSPPPTAAFWAKYVGDGPPGDYVMPGMVLHAVYGVVAGGVFAVVVTAAGLGVGTLGGGLLWGLAYGVLLFAGAAVFWMNVVLGMEADRNQVLLFLFFHLVYGAILGAWVGYGVLA